MKRSEKDSRTLNRVLTAALLGVSLLAIPLGGCASTQKAERPEPPKLMAWEDFKPSTDERVMLAGQPSDAALDRFVDEADGAPVLVVNLRTDKEMAYFPYYDRSVWARGVRYVRIPTSGSELNEDEVEAYAEAVRGHDGPVLLHCASGGRASYLWAMTRMRNEGLSAEEASAWLEELRGEPLSERGLGLLTRYEAERDGVAPDAETE